MRTIALIALVVLLSGPAVPLPAASLAQTSPQTSPQTTAPAPSNPPSPENAAILAGDRAFEQAYAKADLKTLASFFTENAEYTTEEGQTCNGQAAIQEALRDSLGANKGAKLAITPDSVRLLSPGVLLEKGGTTVTAKNGEISSARYTALYLKQDGKWKITQLIESPQPALDPHERLSELGWLAGDWEETDKSNDLAVRTQCLWARGGNFLTRNFTVLRGGTTALEGWQIIGWDPLSERIHSWTFDGAGGFSEATWTRDGQRWLIRETGVSPEGNRTSADNTLTQLSADRFSWESNNRTLNGDPQPGIGRIEINRVKSPKEPLRSP